MNKLIIKSLSDNFLISNDLVFFIKLNNTLSKYQLVTLLKNQAKLFDS